MDATDPVLQSGNIKLAQKRYNSIMDFQLQFVLPYLYDTLTHKLLYYHLLAENIQEASAINKMISRYKDRFLPTFEQKPIITPAMKEKSKTVSESDLMREVSELRRQLNEARLKIEGYEIMGDILEEQYGIDLLKKSAARQLPSSGNDAQK